MNEPMPSQQPQNMGPNKPGAIAPWLLIVFIIVVLAGAGYLGWNYWNQQKAATATPTTTTTTATKPSTTTPSVTTSTASWTAYANTTYGYSLKYPTGWYIYGYKTGDETTTATANIAMVNSQSQSHIMKVSTGNDTEMEAIITGSASKPDYKTSATTLDGQIATQYTWTVVLDGKNVSANKLVKAVKGNYTYYLTGIVTDYNKTATIDQGNFDQILSTFQFAK